MGSGRGAHARTQINNIDPAQDICTSPHPPHTCPPHFQAKPAIYVTYNGDFFDFPFIEKRCSHYGIDLKLELGFKSAGSSGGSGTG